MAEQHRCVFLTAPAESLLTVRAPHAVEDLVLSRRLRWCAATGQSLGDLVTTSLVGVPIPVYRELDGPEPATGEYDPRRQFPRVHPSALRHPLFWLPMRLAARQLFSDGTAETDEEWALRVAIECTESGLYDEATGSWFDVLGSVGLVVDDPVDEARIESWQRGQADPVLDGIDLSDALDIVDRDWAMVFAAELLPALRQATWARLSRDLRRDFEFLTAPDLHIETATLLRETKILADLALSSVAEAPRPDTLHDRVAEWSQVRAGLQATEDREALLAGPVTDALALLDQTYDDYEDVLELILEAAGQSLAEELGRYDAEEEGAAALAQPVAW